MTLDLVRSVCGRFILADSGFCSTILMTAVLNCLLNVSCREVADLQSQLAEMEHSRDALQAQHDSQVLGPSILEKARLRKVLQQVSVLQQQLSDRTAQLQQHQARLVQLQQEQQQMQESAGAAQQQHARAQVQQVVFALKELSAVTADLISCTATALAPSAVEAVGVAQHSHSSSAVPREAIQQQLLHSMALAGIFTAGPPVSGAAAFGDAQAQQALAMCKRMQGDCNRLAQVADEFMPGDALAEGLVWLSKTLQLAFSSLSSCLEAQPQHQQFTASTSSSVLQQQLPALRLLVDSLVSDLQDLTSACLLKGSAAFGGASAMSGILQAARAVLRVCQVQPKGTSAEPGTLQWHLQVLSAPGLQLTPALCSVHTLMRLAVLLVLASCRLARTQALNVAAVDGLMRQAGTFARKLGLAAAVADMPEKAADLRGYIAQQQLQLPFAAAAMQADALVLQCALGFVAGRAAHIQVCSLQLSASCRMLLPASYLSLRVADVLNAWQDSLFSMHPTHSITPGDAGA